MKDRLSGAGPDMLGELDGLYERGWRCDLFELPTGEVTCILGRNHRSISATRATAKDAATAAMERLPLRCR